MSYDSAVASIFPTLPLRWKLDEAAGATVAVNSGSAGASGNMTASSTSMSGQPPLINVGNSYRITDTLGSQTQLTSATAGNAINGLADFTAVLWFKYDQAAGNDFLVDATNGTINGGVSIRKASNTNNIVAHIETSTGSTRWSTASGSMAPGNVYCVAVTWTDDDLMKIYINGTKRTLTIAAGTAIPGGTMVNPADLSLGKWKNAVDSNLGGWLDDVLIAPKYLSDAEALTLYNEGVTRLGTAVLSGFSATTNTGVKVGLSSVSMSSTATTDAAGFKNGTGVATANETTAFAAEGAPLLTAGWQEREANRHLTDYFISTMPVDITLIPRSRQSDGMGGYTWVEESPRAVQTMRLIEYSNEATAPEPVLTPDGHQRYVQYELLGRFDSTIGLWDRFEHDGDEWEVVEMYFYNGWERRAKVARFGNGG